MVSLFWALLLLPLAVLPLGLARAQGGWVDLDAPLPKMAFHKGHAHPARTMADSGDPDAPLPAKTWEPQTRPPLPPPARSFRQLLCEPFDILLDAPLPPEVGDFADMPMPWPLEPGACETSL